MNENVKAEVVHACRIGGEHSGEHSGVCEQCGAEDVELGWAHVCRPCWDAFIESGEVLL